jgi:thiol-disulfide isomerase/thioredoxin
LTHVEVLSEDGQRLDILKFRGKQTVIYAWGDWCRICERTTPIVLDLARDHPEVEFIFINTDHPVRRLRWGATRPSNVTDTRVDEQHFGAGVMRKKRFDFPQLGLVFAVPAYYLINADGTIAARGNGSRFIATLAQLIEAANRRDAPSENGK